MFVVVSGYGRVSSENGSKEYFVTILILLQKLGSSIFLSPAHQHWHWHINTWLRHKNVQKIWTQVVNLHFRDLFNKIAATITSSINKTTSTWEKCCFCSFFTEKRQTSYLLMIQKGWWQPSLGCCVFVYFCLFMYLWICVIVYLCICVFVYLCFCVLRGVAKCLTLPRMLAAVSVAALT